MFTYDHFYKSFRLSIQALVIFSILWLITVETAVGQSPNNKSPHKSLQQQNSTSKVYIPIVLKATSGSELTDEPQTYIVYRVSDVFQRTEIARTGAYIEGATDDDRLMVFANQEEIAAIKALGYEVEPVFPITTQVL